MGTQRTNVEDQTGIDTVTDFAWWNDDDNMIGAYENWVALRYPQNMANLLWNMSLKTIGWNGSPDFGLQHYFWFQVAVTVEIGWFHGSWQCDLSCKTLLGRLDVTSDPWRCNRSNRSNREAFRSEVTALKRQRSDVEVEPVEPHMPVLLWISSGPFLYV